jgi:2-methylcitrate dehydratase PrpD
MRFRAAFRSKTIVFGNNIDHNVLIRVASTAVLTRMLGGTRAQIVDAVSNAWIDTSLAAYRFAPNTGIAQELGMRRSKLAGRCGWR